jgi:hypothetical protein
VCKSASAGIKSVGLLFLTLCAYCCVSGPTSALPANRAYEMVSPPYKGGYGVVQIEAVALSGESVAFFSKGAFAGAPAGLSFIDYVSHREASGWSTSPLMPPANLIADLLDQDVSPSLDPTFALGKPGPNSEAAFDVGTEEEALLHDTLTPDVEANWALAGEVFTALNGKPVTAVYEGASPDFCHVFLAGAGRQPLLREAKEITSPGQVIYELTRGCDGEPASLRLVGLNNQRKPINPRCEVNLGIGFYSGGRESEFNAVASGGKEAFFTTCVGEAVSPHQLFVRLNGEKTLEVSKPISEECSELPCKPVVSRGSSQFVGASEDGSQVFFTSTAQLTSEDTDSSEDLYLARIGCPAGESENCEVSAKEVTSLVLVSRDQSATEAAEVQGVVRVAPDGSRAYFVARGVLSGANAESKAPVKGADNLYVYDSGSRQIEFVADMCSGPGLSGPGGELQQGAVEDVHCPLDLEASGGQRNDAKLWFENEGEAQTAGIDGRYLVFASYGQLTSDDTDTAKDIYRYDAVTGKLERVSVGERGYDANGNNSAFDANIAPGHRGRKVQWQYELDTRTVSEDGSRIVFKSSEPLSPGAVNNLTNAYEWHEERGASVGELALVSTGTSEEPVKDVVISAGGGDVFFVTTQDLVPQDVDGAPDVYDARLVGGFPSVPASRQSCSGDACQGPLTNPAPLLVPGSISQAPGENVPPSKAVVSTKTKKKTFRKKKKSKNVHPRKVPKTVAKKAKRTRHMGKTSIQGRPR